MNHDSKNMLGGVGFYAVLAVCLVVVGTASYFLLFRGGSDQPLPASSAETSVPTQSDTSAQPAIRAVSPERITEKPEEKSEEPVSMPEKNVEETAPVMDPTPVVAQAPQLVVAPLQGDVVAAFSVEQLQYDKTLGDWRTHDGEDIRAEVGTTVLAASAGTVLSVQDDALMGTTVVLSHDGGYQTTYANLQAKPTVSKGDTVSAGQVIGAVGETSIAEAAEEPHLHFSVTKDGDAVDPATFLNG